MVYTKSMERLRVTVSRDGALNATNGHGATVTCRAGWNDACPLVTHTMSVEELHDLRYLIDRAIIAAEEEKARFNKHNR